MIRRQFIQLITLAGAAGIGPLNAVATTPSETVSCQVKGFTCITCAVGLDTLLRQQKGVLSSKSTYPEGRVTSATIRGLLRQARLRPLSAAWVSG